MHSNLPPEIWSKLHFTVYFTSIRQRYLRILPVLYSFSKNKYNQSKCSAEVSDATRRPQCLTFPNFTITCLIELSLTSFTNRATTIQGGDQGTYSSSLPTFFNPFSAFSAVEFARIASPIHSITKTNPFSYKTRKY